MRPVCVMTGVRLTKDPELKYTSGGKAYCNVSVAYNERVKRGDEYEDRPNFFNLVFWEKRAEGIVAHATKGSAIDVRCSPRMDSWTDKDGNKRTGISFTVDEFRCESVQKKDAAAARKPVDPDDDFGDPMGDGPF